MDRVCTGGVKRSMLLIPCERACGCYPSCLNSFTQYFTVARECLVQTDRPDRSRSSLVICVRHISAVGPTPQRLGYIYTYMWGMHKYKSLLIFSSYGPSMLCSMLRFMIVSSGPSISRQAQERRPNHPSLSSTRVLKKQEKAQPAATPS